jgi:hypothetical protein
MFKVILLLIIFLVYNLSKSNEHFNNKKRMIIIGNGPSVLDKENGKLIDSFDKVARFNTFKNDSEYSKFVGTRTDLWFINAKNIRTRSPEIIKMMDNVKYEKIFVEQNPYDPKDKLLKYFPELKDNRKVDFCDIDLFNEIQNKHFNPKGMNPHPSLGLQGINLLANKYPEYELYIIGFDSFNTNKIHYMDKKEVNDTNVKHNLKKEINFLEHLIKKNNIQKL